MYVPCPLSLEADVLMPPPRCRMAGEKRGRDCNGQPTVDVGAAAACSSTVLHKTSLSKQETVGASQDGATAGLSTSSCELGWLCGVLRGAGGEVKKGKRWLFVGADVAAAAANWPRTETSTAAASSSRQPVDQIHLETLSEPLNRPLYHLSPPPPASSSPPSPSSILPAFSRQPAASGRFMPAFPVV
ncbi:hypothetical protein Dda_5279 [Drechslerella dactyloides]|uniref:Uncharacterized protein n=1 Tax=Drechslerella dactyloides TaxID=74499 RepID=A0AAD6IWA2_DREDA|nr:hypothetical protein Dda_5279 [Drechslerella dactyloides]